MVKFLKLKDSVKTNISISGIPIIFRKGYINEVDDISFEKIKEKSMHFFDEVTQEKYKEILEKDNKRQSVEDLDKAKVKLYNDYRLAGLSDIEARQKVGFGATESIKEEYVSGIKTNETKKPETKPVKRIDANRIYTKEEAFDLSKEEQTELLKLRKIAAKDIGAKEADRIKQIINSNPA